MAAARDIDIGDGCRPIETDHEDLPTGHAVQGTILQNSRSGDSLYFERTVDFRCHGMPTSFYFRVTLTVPESKVGEPHHPKFLHSVACIKRTDRGSGLVNVRMVTNVFLDGDCGAAVAHNFPDLGAGKVLRDRGESQDFIPQKMEFAFNGRGKLRFDFVLAVEDCHVEQKRAEPMDTDTQDSEDSSPRKRLRVQSPA